MDIGLTWGEWAADFEVSANDLESDDGLRTAVLLSLFTDRRAEDGDVLPDSETDRRGWWGDNHPVVAGDKIGSRLWLLARSKQTPDVLARAEEYAREALQWLIEDKVASRVDVESGIVRNGVLGLAVTIDRPEVDPVKFQFNYTWESML